MAGKGAISARRPRRAAGGAGEKPAKNSPGALPCLPGFVVWAVALVLAVHSFGFRPLEIRDPDVFWHLATGRWILEHGQIPHSDPFSVLAGTLSWVDHEWLFQLLLRLGELGGGIGLLYLLKTLLYSSAFALPAFWALGRGLSRESAVFACAMLLPAALPFSEYRPIMFSLFLLVVCVEGARRFAASSRLTLAWLPLVFALWANFHATFLLGFMVLGSFALFHRENWRRFGLLIGLCFVATALNPYGVKVWAVPGKVVGSSLFTTANQEWRSPDQSLEFWGFYVALAALAVAAVLGRRQLWGPDAVIVLVMTVAAVRSRRMIPYFAVVGVPVLAAAFDLLRVRLVSQARRWAVCAALLAWCVVIHLWTLHFAFLDNVVVRGKERLPFFYNSFPQQCVQTLLSAGKEGNLFNDYNHGGYLHYAVGPSWKVFIDGRNDLYGERWTLLYNALSLAKGNWREQLERHKINAVIVSFDTAAYRPQNLALALGADTPNWFLADFDDAGMLFLRRSAFPESFAREHEYRIVKPMLLYEEQREQLLSRGELAGFNAELQKRLQTGGRCCIAELLLAEGLCDAGLKEQGGKVHMSARAYFGASRVGPF